MSYRVLSGDRERASDRERSGELGTGTLMLWAVALGLAVGLAIAALIG